MYICYFKNAGPLFVLGIRDRTSCVLKSPCIKVGAFVVMAMSSWTAPSAILDYDKTARQSTALGRITGKDSTSNIAILMKRVCLESDRGQIRLLDRSSIAVLQSTR